MTSDAQPIADWSFDLPDLWFLIPLEQDADESWARSVVEQIRDDDPESGMTGDLVEVLENIRVGLRARADVFTCAAVSVDPEIVMTVGCVLTGRQLELDPDDGPDAFADLLAEGMAHPGPGVRTLAVDAWRDRVPAGNLVGAYQRFERRDPGDAEGRIVDRVVYGVFPVGGTEMIALDFVAENLAEFADMKADTQALVAGLRVELGVVA